MAEPQVERPEGTAQELTDQMGVLIERAGELQTAVAEGSRTANEVKAELEGQVTPRLNALHAAREEAEAKEDIERIYADIKKIASETRHPSKASLIGMGQDPRTNPGVGLQDLITNVWIARVSDDPDERKQALGNLQGMGSRKAYAPSDSAGFISTNADGSAKATLSSTSGVGAGYLVPNALVTSVIELATPRNPYRGLLNVVTGVRTLTINVPTEGLAPARAQVVSEGSTKTNINFVLTNYTVTLYTLAQIFDISNQLMRHSTGAAEQIVRSKLARGWAQGEAYYILQGTGTSEPKGLLTSLGTSGTFVETFTASATTLAGSAAFALSQAAGTLANRSRTPDGAVVNAGDFYTMMRQGTDTAGFFFAPDVGPTGIDPTRGRLTVFGIPVLPDANMPTKDLVVGEWSSAQLYVGDDYRIDVSTEANDRWDKNLTGFRGEEEIGFNGDPYVASGMFQRVHTLVP